LSTTERAGLENLASDYDKFEDRMGKKYHIHFCEVGDRRSSVMGGARISKILLKVAVLTVQTMRSSCMLKQTLDWF
jgi:hypothetical protein